MKDLFSLEKYMFYVPKSTRLSSKKKLSLSVVEELAYLDMMFDYRVSDPDS